jgi:hypothetical protein
MTPSVATKFQYINSSFIAHNVEFYGFYNFNFIFNLITCMRDRLCGLVVRVLDYRCRGPGFDSQALQKKKSSGSGTGCTQPREYN